MAAIIFSRSLSYNINPLSIKALAFRRSCFLADNALAKTASVINVNGGAIIQRINGRPFAGTLLASSIENLAEQWLAILVLNCEYIGTDFYQVGIQQPLYSSH